MLVCAFSCDKIFNLHEMGDFLQKIVKLSESDVPATPNIQFLRLSAPKMCPFRKKVAPGKNLRNRDWGHAPLFETSGGHWGQGK